MTKTIGLFAVLAGLVGCGGAGFSGTFAGTVSRTTTCSDGTGGAQSVPLEWDIRDDGDALTITPLGGNCGLLMADVSGEAATIRQKVCPTVTANGYTTTETLTGGTLSLNGRAITAALNSNVQVSGAGVGSCASVATGTLAQKSVR